VITGSSKAIAGAGVGAGAETFWKSEPEQKQIVSAPQHWHLHNVPVDRINKIEDRIIAMSDINIHSDIFRL
jgi:sporulation protein YlmC with PRC-barrel domain